MVFNKCVNPNDTINTNNNNINNKDSGKTVKVNMRLPRSMYNDIQKLKNVMRLQDDSKTIRFCIAYTLASINKLDKEIVAQIVASEISKMLFNIDITSLQNNNINVNVNKDNNTKK